MAGSLDVVDLLGVLDGAHVVHGVRVERISASFFLGEGQIVVFVVAQVQVGDADGHRAIHEDGKARNAVGVLQLADDVHDGLRAVHGERRDHDHAAAFGDAIDDVRQRILGRIGWMIAVSVGRFAEQHVAARRRFRILQNRLVVAAHIAGKQDHGLLAVFRDRQFEAG